MENKPQHTPTPLIADLTVTIKIQNHEEEVIEIIGPTGETVGYIEPDSTAFIVKCVNAHDEMLRALKTAQSRYRLLKLPCENIDRAIEKAEGK